MFRLIRIVPGAVISSLNTRRGSIVASEVSEDEFTITAEVALNDMFGYSSHLRGITQGKGTHNFISELLLLLHILMTT